MPIGNEVPLTSEPMTHAADSGTPQERNSPISSPNAANFPQGYEDKEKENEDLLGDQVTLKVTCSTGQIEYLEMRMGQEVGKAKIMLSDKLEVAYNRITLFINDNLMMDPLSLSDIAEIEAGMINAVRCEIKDE